MKSNSFISRSRRRPDARRGPIMVPTAVSARGEEGDRMAHESRVREAVASLRPIDDVMFRLMTQSRAFCEEVLRVLLEDP